MHTPEDVHLAEASSHAPAAHTPGPWRYWTQRREPEDTCTFRSIRGDEVLRAVTVTLTEADARLIAAAPEMLEALHDCREALRRAGADGELAVVDAAIAKATGDARFSQ
jgi:hypothetical protein